MSCSSRTWEAKAGGSQSQHGLHSETLCQRTETNKKKSNYISDVWILTEAHMGLYK
jgi:hypothetical protein